MRYPASGPPRRLRGPADRRPAEDDREAAGVPLASRSATRVSARSTLTSTCFFNLIQSFGVEVGRAGWQVPAPSALGRRAPTGWAPGAHAAEAAGGRRGRAGTARAGRARGRDDRAPSRPERPLRRALCDPEHDPGGVVVW